MPHEVLNTQNEPGATRAPALPTKVGRLLSELWQKPDTRLLAAVNAGVLVLGGLTAAVQGTEHSLQKIEVIHHIHTDHTKRHKDHSGSKHHESGAKKEQAATPSLPSSVSTPTPSNSPLQAPPKPLQFSVTNHNLSQLIDHMLGPKGTKGIDISWPQCVVRRDSSGNIVSARPVQLPAHEDFVLVGVNNGHAGSKNPCLTPMLEYAYRATGKLAVTPYYFPRNRGPNDELWPKNGRDPNGKTICNPYGKCNGSYSLACAYDLGWNSGWQDENKYYLPAVAEAGLVPSPLAVLDLESAGKFLQYDPAGKLRNQAMARGMVDYLSQRYQVVEYTNSGIKGSVVGPLVQPGRNSLAHARLNWVPAQPKSCKAAPLEDGSTNFMDQRTHVVTFRSFDHKKHSLQLDTDRLCI